MTRGGGGVRRLTTCPLLARMLITCMVRERRLETQVLTQTAAEEPGTTKLTFAWKCPQLQGYLAHNKTPSPL